MGPGSLPYLKLPYLVTVTDLFHWEPQNRHSVMGHWPAPVVESIPGCLGQWYPHTKFCLCGGIRTPVLCRGARTVSCYAGCGECGACSLRPYALQPQVLLLTLSQYSGLTHSAKAGLGVYKQLS